MTFTFSKPDATRMCSFVYILNSICLSVSEVIPTQWTGYLSLIDQRTLAAGQKRPLCMMYISKINRLCNKPTYIYYQGASTSYTFIQSYPAVSPENLANILFIQRQIIYVRACFFSSNETRKRAPVRCAGRRLLGSKPVCALHQVSIVMRDAELKPLQEKCGVLVNVMKAHFSFPK